MRAGKTGARGRASTTASRSAANSSPARWQWESIMLSMRRVRRPGHIERESRASARSRPRPRRHVLIEADQHRLAAVRAGGEHHAVRLDAHQLRRLQVEDDDDVRPTSCSGSYASAMPATSVRCSVPTSIVIFTSLRGLRHLLGRQHLRDPQIDLHEVVDRDAVARDRRPARRGRRCRRGRAPRVSAPDLPLASVRRRLPGLVVARGHRPQFLHVCSIRGNNGSIRPRRAPGVQRAGLQA